MSTHAVEGGKGLDAHLTLAARNALAWLGAGLVLGFTVPFLFADTLDLPRDLYYGVYAASIALFFLLWARATNRRLGAMLRCRWRASLALGLAAAGILALVVFRSADATPRPEGIDLIAAVLWRGVVYGAMDGLLLSVFPILVVFGAFEGTRARQRPAGKLAIGAAALAASLAMTAVYHVGYSDFRSEKVREPLAGDLVWSAPTLLTLNPIGAPIAHAGMHVTAVLHSYETDLFLPPHS